LRRSDLSPHWRYGKRNEMATAYALRVENKGGHLHIIVTGDNTPENVARYLSEVRDKCVEHHCPNVLIEENLRGPSLRLSTIYNIVTEAGNQVWPMVRRIAYIDANPEHHTETLQFAETVAVNRAVNIRFFSSVVDAEKWLGDLKEGN
jgi:hypothetical protein